MPEQTRYVEQVPMQIEPVTLEGRRVRLIPMTHEHAEALFKAASFPEIWEHTGTFPINSLEAMKRYVGVALEEQEAGRAIPLVTTDPVTGEVIGSTRFANISVADRRVEIG
ncbi:MAG TPA: GNAT family N-acetyltransferase, partial [Gemmatimonadaceae bacterium]